MCEMMEENVFKTELSQMEIRLTDMEEKIDLIDTKLTQVVDAILGNPLTKTGGFISEMENLRSKVDMLERRQEKFDEFRKRISWTLALIMGLILLIQYVTNIYSNVK